MYKLYDHSITPLLRDSDATIEHNVLSRLKAPLHKKWGSDCRQTQKI